MYSKGKDVIDMLRVGIMGCGQMAAVMAENLTDITDVTVVAVASRDKKRANAFAKKYCPYAKAYGSYEGLATAPDVDLVYISTPNTYHYENAIKCLKEYKNILVEKPFVMSKAEADSIFSEAKNRNLFVCEAMWTAFMPLHEKLIKWIKDGRIGAVRYMSSNLGYDIKDRPRLTDPLLGGGAYLDLGVYPTHLAMSVMGDDIYPVSVRSRKYSTGIDEDTSYILERSDGAQCVSYVTMDARTDADAAVIGEKGYIKIKNINNYERIELFDKDGKLIDSDEKSGLSGYSLEVKACAEAIRNGFIQCRQMPWSRTAALAGINDQIISMM